MTLVLAAVVGSLFAAGTFLLLRRNLVHVVWGLTILSQGANVYLLAVAGVHPPGPDAAPILQHHEAPFAETADPLVQALVLTAIVIGFGLTAFALALTYRVYEEHGTIDTRELEEEW